MVEQRDNVEKTLGKILTVVLLLGLLMSIFLYYFFKQEDQIEQTGLRTIAANFNSQLLMVRSQWYMDNKPDIVAIQLNTADDSANKKNITVNNNGWIDVVTHHSSNVNQRQVLMSSRNICQEIWQLVMDKPLSFFNMPIGAVLINKTQDDTGHLCRYIVKNGYYFEYNSKNGNVSEVYHGINE